jgi:hypothetical protein
MKKLIFCLLTLYVSAFISAQDANVTETPQKPSKEDFYHTWTAKIAKMSFETTFINESSYIQITRYMIKETQNYSIISWEEAVNTYTEVEEYPYGFNISAKDTKYNSILKFAVFMNADKTKYLSVIDMGFSIQYAIYTKKETKKK